MPQGETGVGFELGWEWSQPLLGGGEGPGEGVGGGFGRRFLGRKNKAKTLELLGSGLGSAVGLVYGRALLGGNVVLQHKNADKTVSILIALGEGEMEGPEVVWVNGARLNTGNTAKYHFHPGLDGEIFKETDPATRNQKLCSFFPDGFRPRLTFSRTAYAALNLPRDKKHPKKTREFEVFGVYRGLRVRQFDNAGNQTAYAWSANPAWCCLDLLIRRYLKPHGAVNEALTSAEKARIDFQAFKDWADFCDATLTINGESVKRAECHVAFGEEADLLRALELILVAGRAYLLERNGKLAPYADTTRSSVLTLDADDLAADSLQLSQRPVRDLPNLARFTYRDLDSGRGLGTISSSGATVTGVDTAFLTWFEKDGVIDLRSGAQKGEFRRVKAIASDTSLTLGSAFSANQPAGTLYGNPAKDFEERVREAVNEDHQDDVGRIQEFEADLGGQTPERAERLSEYLLRSVTERRKAARFTILSGVSGALDLLPGDVITAPADLEFLTTRAYEVMEITDNPDGSRAVEALEYQASVFVDTAGAQPQPADQPDLSEAFAVNAQTIANLLKNGSFYRIGVAGQEGTANARHFKLYSNTGGSPASPTDIEWISDRDVYVVKTKTSTVDKIGIRSLWNNLGLMLKPAQTVTVAVSLRHAGAAGVLYDKDIKVKIDSDAQDYNDASGNDFAFTIPADSLADTFSVFYHTFTLRSDIAVPNTLNVFIWSEATGAAKSNEDYEIDWVTLAPGGAWTQFDPQAVSYSQTWNSGAGLYDIDNSFIKNSAPSSDTGGAGESSSSGHHSDPDASGGLPS